MKNANNIMSLEGLGLSTTAHSCVLRRYATVEEAIENGRRLALWHEGHPEERGTAPKWELELVSKLDEMGLIRHDLLPYIVPVYRLACEMCNVDFFSLFTAKTYENINVNKEQYAEVLNAILSNKGREPLVIIYRFGFNNGGVAHNLDDTASCFKTGREYVRKVIAKGLRRLVRSEKGKNILKTTGHKDPCPHSIAIPKNAGANDSIDELNLSVRAYNVIHRAGLRTVSDILNLPKEEWSCIKNCGKKVINNIVEAMRASGYPEFNIPGSSCDSSH